MQYSNLEQRMAQRYIALFPPFVPLGGVDLSIQSQEQFYNFMKGIYQILFDSPELFFKAIQEDDAFPNRFNKASYGKPKLDSQMKKDLKQIDDLIALLFTIGQNGVVEGSQMVIGQELKINKKARGMLPVFDLSLEGQVLTCEKFDKLFPVWRWMATRDKATMTNFSRCMFDPDYPYMEEVYARIFGSPQAYDSLIQYLHARGYQRVDLRRGPDSVDYVKQIAVKPSVLKKAGGELPVGFPQHGDPYHYGLSMEYRPYASTPQFMTLRILDMKNLLLKFNSMPSSLQDFTLNHVKKCDLCGYCTQTDKTGTRKPIFVEVEHAGATHPICPLYPGFNFCFTEVDEARTESLVGFLDLMDEHLTAGAQ